MNYPCQIEAGVAGRPAPLYSQSYCHAMFHELDKSSIVCEWRSCQSGETLNQHLMTDPLASNLTFDGHPRSKGMAEQDSV